MDDKIKKAKEFLGDKYLLSPANRVQRIDSINCVSVTELTHNTKDVIDSARVNPVAIFNHKHLVAYLISPDQMRVLLENRKLDQ